MYDLIEEFCDIYKPKFYNGDIYVYNNGYSVLTTEIPRFLASKEVRIAEYRFKKHLKDFITEVIEKEMDRYIPLSNGLYDIETEKIIPFDHSIFFLKSKILPFSFDESKTCNKFNEFLFETILEEKHREILLDFMAYTLIPGNFLQKALILVGRGANGKSTFLTFFSKFLNESVGNFSLKEIEGKKTPFFFLSDKYVNVFSDLPASYISSLAIFKSITGEDTLTISKTNRESFKIRPSFKLIFSANVLPNFKDNDFAVLRRLLILPFEKTFDVKPNYLDTLISKEEFQGLFNLLRMRFKRLKTTGFLYNQAFDEIKNFYFSFSDSSTQFFYEEVFLSKEEIETLDNVYVAYANFCSLKFKRIATKQIFSIKLRMFLKNWGLKIEEENNELIIKGIKLKTPVGQEIEKKVNLPEKTMEFLTAAREELRKTKNELSDEEYVIFAKKIFKEIFPFGHPDKNVFPFILNFLKQKDFKQ